MLIETLDVLRCPYCGGRLALVDSLFHRRTTEESHDGILGCHCCIFPLVDGIPVLHVLPAATVPASGRGGPGIGSVCPVGTCATTAVTGAQTSMSAAAPSDFLFTEKFPLSRRRPT